MPRHLTSSDVLTVLRRGVAVEQLLGIRLDEEDRVLSWLRIHVDRVGKFVVSEFQAFDDRMAGIRDVYELEPLDPDKPFGSCREFERAEDAVEYATTLGATLERFVNDGLIGDEYEDLHERGRTSTNEDSHDSP